MRSNTCTRCCGKPDAWLSAIVGLAPLPARLPTAGRVPAKRDRLPPAGQRRYDSERNGFSTPGCAIRWPPKVSSDRSYRPPHAATIDIRPRPLLLILFTIHRRRKAWLSHESNLRSRQTLAGVPNGRERGPGAEPETHLAEHQDGSHRRGGHRDGNRSGDGRPDRGPRLFGPGPRQRDPAARPIRQDPDGELRRKARSGERRQEGPGPRAAERVSTAVGEPGRVSRRVMPSRKRNTTSCRPGSSARWSAARLTPPTTRAAATPWGAC